MVDAHVFSEGGAPRRSSGQEAEVMLWVIGGVAWFLVGAVPAYALFLAYWQRKFPALAEKDADRDVTTAALLALMHGVLGPIGLALALIETGAGRFGMMWRPGTPR